MIAPVLGRKRPYTEKGIRRLKCTRCGKRADHQWQCCANGNRWLPVCLECDIDLNAELLKFMRVPNSARLLREYATKQIVRVAWSKQP